MATKSAITSRLRLGREGYRAMERNEKRWERARVQIRKGASVYHDGLRHPSDCPCYDCSYGQIAEWKRAVRLGTTPKLMALAAAEASPGRTGRDAGARVSQMVGVRSGT